MDQKLSSRCRRRASHIRAEIGDGEVGFVTDAGDDGNVGHLENCPGYRFLVETPEIFEGASSTAKHDYIGSEKAGRSVYTRPALLPHLPPVPVLEESGLRQDCFFPRQTLIKS